MRKENQKRKNYEENVKMCAKIIDVNEENIEQYGLFCRKSYMKEEGNVKKVEWLKKRFKEGLKHKILYVKENNKETSRGFIEYIPGEYNWRGIHAPNYMVIHCLWVTGKAKKKGHGTELLNEAIKDARESGMDGVVGMTADKQGWLPSPKIFIKNEFEKVDEIKPYFSMYVKKFNENAPSPKFNPINNQKAQQYGDGITILYSYQCPHICNMNKEIEDFAKKQNIPVKTILMEDCMDSQQNELHPYGIYLVLHNGEFITYKPGMRKETIEKIRSKNVS
jgi:ribosomal protein S18 acetylase RimI-like enzyme